MDKRGGPKFDNHQSSAEEFGQMFGSATCDCSAEVWPNYGRNLASLAAMHLRHFALAADANVKSLYLLLVTS